MAKNGTKCDFDIHDKDVMWEFCPNVSAAYIMAAAFTITLIAHISQGVIHRKGYSWVVSMSALWQAACYFFRVVSIRNPKSETPFIAWFILINIAPIWLNAYIYQVFGRVIFNFTDTARLAKIKAWRFGLYFVLLDILAFLIQIFGIASAVGKDKDLDDVKRGLNIYKFGIGFQQFWVVVFCGLVVTFQIGLRRQAASIGKSRATTLVLVTYAVLLAITVRIIFRLVEFMDPESQIPNKEVYQYTLDSLPMLLALILLNIFHPGRLMPGSQCDFPPRRERKNYHKSNKESLIPTAANMGSYVPMEGLSRSSSPDNAPYRNQNHSDSYSAGQSSFTNAVPYGGGAPQPAYPAGTPYQNPGSQGRPLGRF